MSKTFFISYDLLGTGRSKDYQKIETVLINSDAERVLINLWAYKGPQDSTTNIRDVLLKLLNRDDRLLVIEANEWAWYLGKPL